jgi:sporulation protein YlmC with PRC-barrel domain
MTIMKEATMKLRDHTHHRARATTLPDIRYAPDRNRSQRASLLLILIVIVAALGFVLVAGGPRSALSQAVQLVRVDVSVVARGYRVSKLLSHSVVNDKNEDIGKIDDIVIAHDKSLFTVLQVGGFLGIGSRFVVVPFDSLKIDENGNKIELPGATKDELKKLSEFKYSS